MSRGLFARFALPLALMFLATPEAGRAAGRSIHDPASYPLVWTEPGIDAVQARLDVEYREGAGAPLRIDVYHPAGPAPEGGRPGILVVSGVGDRGADPRKDWEIYRSWLKTMAARGFVAAMGESDPRDVRGSLGAQLAWLAARSGELGLDPARIGLWANAENVPASLDLAMSPPPGSALRAAVFLYGAGEVATLRGDLPVMLLIAGRDAPEAIEAERRLAARAVEARAPWTVVELPTLPPAFDAFDRSRESRVAVRQVLDFLEAELERLPDLPIESPEAKAAREALANLASRRFEAAHEYYNDLSDAPSVDDPQIFRNLAWARRGLGEPVGEMVALEQALKLAPDDLPLRRRYTRLAAILGGWESVERGLGPIEGSPEIDAEDLALLGLARLHLEQPQEAVAPLERAVALGAEPETVYNLACALALTGRIDEAFRTLAEAIAAGFADRETLASDPDIASLRDDPRFTTLMAGLPAPATADPERP